MSDDFRRLEEVRSRLRSRRRRRLGAAAITTGAAALAAVSALAAPTVTGFLLSRSGRPVAPLSVSVSLVDDVRGQVTGWVKAVAPESGIIRVSSGAFGLRSLALVVTRRQSSSSATRRAASATSGKAPASKPPTKATRVACGQGESKCSPTRWTPGPRVCPHLALNLAGSDAAACPPAARQSVRSSAR